jgi:hypothetical protein
MQMKKMIFILVLLFGTIANYPAFAEERPIFVFCSMHLDVTEGGKLVPEIAVNSDGTWRKATLKDVWLGQEFEFFDQVTKDPKIGGKVVINSIGNDFFVRCNTKDNFDNDYTYWGIYKTKRQFINLAKGKAFKSKYNVDTIVQKILFNRKKNIKTRLQNMVKQDWKNIQREFPKLKTSNVFDFMMGDINGDKKNDYVLVLSDPKHVKGAAGFIYLSNGTKLTMIPLDFWEEVSQSTGCITAGFMMDFNGDKAKEFVMFGEDGDSCSPMIYGWNKDKQGLMTLYKGDELYTW